MIVIEEVIRTTILNHPKDCIFTPDAVKNIIAKWKVSGFRDVYEFGAEDFLVEAIMAEEIYCPHEGIDKRPEYYVKINLAGWLDWAAIAHEMI